MSFFITIYTDASVRPQKKETQIAWVGKCAEGTIRAWTELEYHQSVTRAEMFAIYYAIKDAMNKWPHLEGFFINSDNMGCVTSFWSFSEKHKVPDTIKDIYDQIVELAAGRWIRAKHVKAHTGKDDVRSYLNREVDRMTRRKIACKVAGN